MKNVQRIYVKRCNQKGRWKKNSQNSEKNGAMSSGPTDIILTPARRGRFVVAWGLPRPPRPPLSTRTGSVTSKKSPNVYKKWPKTDFTRKIKDFDTFNKSPKNVAIWAKQIVATGFEKLPKFQ